MCIKRSDHCCSCYINNVKYRGISSKSQILCLETLLVKTTDYNLNQIWKDCIYLTFKNAAAQTLTALSKLHKSLLSSKAKISTLLLLIIAYDFPSGDHITISPICAHVAVKAQRPLTRFQTRKVRSFPKDSASFPVGCTAIDVIPPLLTDHVRSHKIKVTSMAHLIVYRKTPSLNLMWCRSKCSITEQQHDGKKIKK